MSYSRVQLGNTEFPMYSTPEEYCRTYIDRYELEKATNEQCQRNLSADIITIQGLRDQLTACQRNAATSLSSCQASAAGASAGAAQARAELQTRYDALSKQFDTCRNDLKTATAALTGAQGRIATLQQEIDTIKSGKPKSCLFWVIATVVGAGATIAVAATKKKSPKQLNA